MFDRGFPKRGLSMETIAALFGAIARGLRGLFDLASMAVGVAPNAVGIADAACVPTGSAGTATWQDTLHRNLDIESSKATQEWEGRWGVADLWGVEIGEHR